MVVKHELGRCEARLALHGELVGPMSDFGSLDLFHHVGEEKGFVAGMEYSRGRNGPYEAFAPAARSRCLVWIKIPTRMTWGVVRSE